ncbi:MAG: hypothetical protein FJ319_03350 [SAR202 cluster bacterium]|nr:hypothetical protein [SAR202 cluster bacterium]
MTNEKPYIPEEVAFCIEEASPSQLPFKWIVAVEGEFRSLEPRKLFGIIPMGMAEGAWTPLLEDMMDEVLRQNGRGVALLRWYSSVPERDIRRCSRLFNSAGTSYRAIAQESSYVTLIFELTAQNGCEIFYDVYDFAKKMGYMVYDAYVFLSKDLELDSTSAALGTKYDESRLWSDIGKKSEVVVQGGASFDVLTRTKRDARTMAKTFAAVWANHGVKTEIEDASGTGYMNEPQTQG